MQARLPRLRLQTHVLRCQGFWSWGSGTLQRRNRSDMLPGASSIGVLGVRVFTVDLAVIDHSDHADHSDQSDHADHSEHNSSSHSPLLLPPSGSSFHTSVASRDERLPMISWLSTDQVPLAPAPQSPKHRGLLSGDCTSYNPASLHHPPEDRHEFSPAAFCVSDVRVSNIQTPPPPRPPKRVGKGSSLTTACQGFFLDGSARTKVHPSPPPSPPLSPPLPLRLPPSLPPCLWSPPCLAVRNSARSL